MHAEALVIQLQNQGAVIADRLGLLMHRCPFHWLDTTRRLDVSTRVTCRS